MADPAGESAASQYGEILRFVRRRSDSRAAAEDLTQQVFLEATVALRGRDAGSDLGLLYTIARRRLIDRLRASRPDVLPLEAAADIPVPSQYGAEIGRGIGAAIDRLAPQQRELVALRLLRGLSFAETAAIIGTSEAACKQRLRAVLDILRADLEQNGLHP